MRKIVRVLLFVGAQLLAGCGGSKDVLTEPEALGTPAALGANIPIFFDAIGGSSRTIIITVVDRVGTPVLGVPVDFSVTGGGTVNQARVNTTSNGVASVAWQFAKTAGRQTMTVTAPRQKGPAITLDLAADVTLATVSGTWTGTIAGTAQTLTMTLVENSGVVNGSGTLTGTPTGTRAQVINGTFLNGNVALTLTSGTVQPFSYTAALNIVTGSTLTGTVTGSGFAGESLVMQKTP